MNQKFLQEKITELWCLNFIEIWGIVNAVKGASNLLNSINKEINIDETELKSLLVQSIERLEKFHGLNREIIKEISDHVREMK